MPAAPAPAWLIPSTADGCKPPPTRRRRSTRRPARQPQARASDGRPSRMRPQQLRPHLSCACRRWARALVVARGAGSRRSHCGDAQKALLVRACARRVPCRRSHCTQIGPVGQRLRLQLLPRVPPTPIARAPVATAPSCPDCPRGSRLPTGQVGAFSQPVNPRGIFTAASTSSISPPRPAPWHPFESLLRAATTDAVCARSGGPAATLHFALPSASRVLCRRQLGRGATCCVSCVRRSAPTSART